MIVVNEDSSERINGDLNNRTMEDDCHLDRVSGRFSCFLEVNHISMVCYYNGSQDNPIIPLVHLSMFTKHFITIR